MAIDLRAFIEDDRAIKHGGYTGAIFLTYTLNLSFFEQIVAPALDRAGCANVLIITDPDGYAEAIKMGHRKITGVGLRYVCVPLPRIGRGVQHAKMLLMAGPKDGRLLIGSGNLTYHGYGRNLELYSCFEYNRDKPDDAALYSMQKAWDFVQRSNSLGSLPPVALNQIQEMKNKAAWLSEPMEETTEFQIWDNLNQPIWRQLQNWRQRAGFASEPINSLLMISPFFDKDAGAVKQITSELFPNQIRVVVDPSSTNLNGRILQNEVKEFPLQLLGIKANMGQDPESRKRPLHAKAMVGIEKKGAWCISGSSNMTRPALLESWHSSGNLELVTFRWSEDKSAFNYIIEDPSVQLWTIPAESLEGSMEAPSDQPKQEYANFFFEYLSAYGMELVGKVNQLPNGHSTTGQIQFLRKDWKLTVTVDEDGSFRVNLPTKLEEPDAVCLYFDGAITPYRWIDQPDLLARYGERSYQVRIQRHLETFDGAGKFFEELLNFLWERTNPELIQEQQAGTATQQRRNARPTNEDRDIPEAPAPTEFILTDQELLERINRRIRIQNPYDRSTWSLRDLLSIVLLRLTTPTSPGTESTDDDDETGGNKGVLPDELDDREREAISRKRLRDYVIQYCRKYGRRLVELEFIAAISPALLFENHFTLGRVLFELASKGNRFPEFTSKDFQECTWWLWAPLVWPSIVDLGTKSTFSQLRMRFSEEEIRSQWIHYELSSLALSMFYRAFKMPPHWREGLRDTVSVSRHLAIKELFKKLEKQLEMPSLAIQESGVREAFGMQSHVDLTDETTDASQILFDQLQKYLAAMENYRSPAEERIAPILALAINQGADPQLYSRLLPILEENDLVAEWKAYQQNPKRIRPISTDADDEGEVYCVCGAALTKTAVNQLKRGRIAKCTQSGETWLYQLIRLPNKIL